MEKFKKYLILSQIVPENKVKFYVNWVSKLYYSFKKDSGAVVTQNEINEYLKNLSKHCEEWQLNRSFYSAESSINVVLTDCWLMPVISKFSTFDSP